ncbi:MAG TPA: diaminopimelate decarboxylase [bacterium]|nr:diaminopimelate decarboxylase [bacterium]
MRVKVDKYPGAGIKNGKLTFGGADTVALAKKFGTPLYVLDEETLRGHCRAYREAFEKRYENVKILFATKSNAMLAVLSIMTQEGLGLDAASIGELSGAARAGADFGNVLLHGNYKKEDEIKKALMWGVGRIVLDSEFEADTVDRVARKMKMKARVMLRVTPGVEAHVHEMVQVGKLDSKFGVPIEGGAALGLIGYILKKRNLDFCGIHYHIGSQILEAEPFKKAVRIGVEFIAKICNTYAIEIKDFDIGGGFPVRYSTDQVMPKPEKFAAVICGELKKGIKEFGFAPPRLLLEPGRGLAGPAGITLYTIGPVKRIPGVRNYVAVDGGLSDNPRPALYGSLYEAVIANKPDSRSGVKKFRVSGRHCETDTLIPEIDLPDPATGDVMAVFSTGAYTYSMSGNYNKFPRPATVLIRNGKAELVVRRETLEDLYACDILTSRLKNAGRKSKK